MLMLICNKMSRDTQKPVTKTTRGKKQSSCFIYLFKYRSAFHFCSIIRIKNNECKPYSKILLHNKEFMDHIKDHNLKSAFKLLRSYLNIVISLIFSCYALIILYINDSPLWVICGLSTTLSLLIIILGAKVVDEIFNFAREFVYLKVSCCPAKKTLPNGENAHCTIQPPDWGILIFDNQI